MKIDEEIKSLIDPIVAAHDVFIVDIVQRGERGTKILEIFIDNLKGITAEICSNVSRALSMELDKTDIIKGKYYLNVSSPGLSRPLKFLKQYPKHIGSIVEVKYKNKELTEEINAELIEIKENKVILKTKTNTLHEIIFDDIIETKVKTPW